MNETERPSMVLVTRQGRVATLTLSLPRRRNALARQMRDELSAALTELNDDDGIGALVITGDAGHFSAGGDISEMRERTLLETHRFFESVVSLVRQLASGPKPLVAAIEGVCIGAGLSMAALCDYIVTANDARFAAAFMRVGLIPDLGGLWSITRRVGPAKATELFGLAREFNGAEAVRIGLANEAVDKGHSLARAQAVAAEYARMPAVAAALLRAAMAQGRVDFESAMRLETDYQSVLLGTQDHREAVSAFLEKRAPAFTGR